MKTSRLIVALCFLALSIGVTAWAEKSEPTWEGTIKVTGKLSKAELEKLAKVTEDDAKKTALEAVPGTAADKKVEDAELEVEHGYLVWSVELKVKDLPGEVEVLVDAGNGKVLAHSNESEPDEAKEKAEDEKTNP